MGETIDGVRLTKVGSQMCITRNRPVQAASAVRAGVFVVIGSIFFLFIIGLFRLVLSFRFFFLLLSFCSLTRGFFFRSFACSFFFSGFAFCFLFRSFTGGFFSSLTFRFDAGRGFSDFGGECFTFCLQFFNVDS